MNLEMVYFQLVCAFLENIAKASFQAKLTMRDRTAKREEQTFWNPRKHCLLISPAEKLDTESVNAVFTYFLTSSGSSNGMFTHG